MNPSPALRLVCATLGLLALLASPPAHAQPAPGAARTAYSDGAAPQALARFDLDFPGGTPAELVAAITQASNEPLNVIIPAEHADVQLPALRFKGVNVPELFRALREATKKTTIRFTSQSSWATLETNVAFSTQNEASPASIWFFKVEGVTPDAPVTRFYSLAFYLQQGLTVDDITTAIRTGWEMRGDKETPALKFHPETQILIAFGQPEKLAVIADVLKVLEPTVAIRAQAAAEAAPKPTDEEKAARRAAELRRRQAIPQAPDTPQP